MKGSWVSQSPTSGMALKARGSVEREDRGSGASRSFLTKLGRVLEQMMRGRSAKGSNGQAGG